MLHDTTPALSEPATAPSAKTPARGLWPELLALAGFCAFFFYFGLGSFGLTGADEPRYAQIAREMLARHDWVTPVLNGAPWLEKPALYYWGAMLSYRIFWVSEFTARLPSAVLATGMIAAIYFFMRRFRPGAQLDAALIAASSAAVIGFARAASTDMPLAATLTIGMLAWYAWFQTQRRRWLAVFYISMGFATLAKGPVAPFLAAAIIAIFALVRHEPRLIVRTLWWPAVLLFFLVAMPWYAAVQLRNPEFFRTFFIAHNFERFSQDVFHHRQPFWYYLPVLLLMMAPWTVYAVVAIVTAFYKRAAEPPEHRQATSPERAKAPRSGDAAASLRRDSDAVPLPAFLLVWLLVPVVFFSFSQSKLPGYILPAVPAFALLLADYLRGRTPHDSKPNLLLLILHSAVGAALLGCVLLVQYLVLKLVAPAQAKFVAGAVAAVVFVAMALTLRLRGLRMLRFVTLVPAILALAFIVRVGAPALDDTLSERPVWRELERINTAQMPLAVFQARREVEYGLNFYANHAIDRYERGEIPAGQHLVVAPEGSQERLQMLIPGRRVSRIGEFPRQRLEFFWVSAPGAGHEHHHM